MWRTVLGALVGLLLGVAIVVVILRLGYEVVAWMKEQPFELEATTIYLTLTLGAGFGALTGAVAGLASALTKALREGRVSPPS